MVCPPNHSTPLGTQDILKCTADEVRGFACQKSHPNLNRAFLEVGTPWQNNEVTGSKEGITAALKKRGHERLHRVAQLIAGGQGVTTNQCTEASVG